MNYIRIFEENIFTYLYYQSPLLILIVFFLIGLISLLVCPKEIRTIELRTNDGIIDVGFLSSYNWSVIYPIIVPVSLFLVISLYQSIPFAILNLINSGVIFSRDSQSDIYQLINNSICKNDFLWIFFIFIISILLNFLDFSSYYFEKEKGKDITKVKDWTVAFQGWSKVKISKRKNLMFNFVMYSQQCFISFVTFVFVYKAYRIVNFFYEILYNKNPDISYKLDYVDVYRQYGFWGVNPIVTYIFFLVVLILSFFTIIRFVHVSRGIKWKFFPRYLSYTFILLVIMGVVSFYSVIYKNLETKKNIKIMELLIEKDKINTKINSDTLNELTFLKYNELLKSTDNDIASVLSQDILSLNSNLYYIFIAIYIFQIRLIIFPPKSWTEALRNILKEEA